MAKKTVTNTTAAIDADPIPFMAEQMITGRAIENSERRGQRELVESEVLPSAMDEEGCEALREAGVEFGDVVQGDPIFRYVNLPQGWRMQETDHAMHSVLLDERGRPRANIFYKAAFYDRRASITVAKRYRVSVDYDRSEVEHVMVAQVLRDGKDVVYETAPIPITHERPRYKLSGEASELACKWLDENKPEWKSPAAYWDEA